MSRAPADILAERLRTVLAITEANAALRRAQSEVNGAEFALMDSDPEAARARMMAAQARIDDLDSRLAALDRELDAAPR